MFGKYLSKLKRLYISSSRTFLDIRKLRQVFLEKIVIVLLTLIIIGFGVGLISSYSLSFRLVESQAEQFARVAVKTLNTAREIYSNQVVKRVQDKEGISVLAEHHTVEGAIPNPATYTIEVGEALSDRTKGMLFRLYSDYPFPNRIETGGPKDSFEWDALEYLRKNPTESFYQTEHISNKLTFRYAEAVTMKASCVACHNTLAKSPKKDWKIGDVRGIIEVTQPLDDIMLIAKDGLKNIYLGLGIILALAIFGLSLVMIRFQAINRDLEEKVRLRTAKLKLLAMLDGLTQLSNRRHFDQHLKQEWNRAQRHQYPLSLMICDVDYFKPFNDTYGHQAGDECLKAVAQVLKDSIRRSGELAARYGGEEFAIILPNVDSENVGHLAQLIRQEIHRLQIPHTASQVKPYLTISMGIATVIPNKHFSIDDVIRTADQALYCAKEQGRDRFKKVIGLSSFELQG